MTLFFLLAEPFAICIHINCVFVWMNYVWQVTTAGWECGWSICFHMQVRLECNRYYYLDVLQCWCSFGIRQYWKSLSSCETQWSFMQQVGSSLQPLRPYWEVHVTRKAAVLSMLIQGRVPFLCQIEWLCWLEGLSWSGHGVFVWFCFITNHNVSPNYCEMSLASVFPDLCGLAAENNVISSFSLLVHLGRFGMG